MNTETIESSSTIELDDIPVSISIELVQKMVTLKDLGSLQRGDVLELNKRPGELVDLIVAGRVIAKGELVDIEGELGVRIASLVSRGD